VNGRRGPEGFVWVLRFRRHPAGEDWLITEGVTLMEAWTAAADGAMRAEYVTYEFVENLN
jgi:hypothetical protein